jgi:hypothetical protein
MIKSLIRWLFLIKEVADENGVIWFRRYRLLSTPWFGVYIHRIYANDPDPHPHNHPWDFFSMVLGGSYQETNKDGLLMPLRRFGSMFMTRIHEYHKIYYGDPATVLVLTGRDIKEWGYWTQCGFIDRKTYRQLCDGKA